FDAAIAAARGVADPAARAAAYRAAEALVVEQDAAVVPLAWSVNELVAAPQVQGLTVDALGRVAFDVVTIAATAR
ncbi:MAG: hypothetical protein AB7Q27_29345, partial [Acidimicrobiia bacterium]